MLVEVSTFCPFSATASLVFYLLLDVWALPVADEVLLVEDGSVGAEEGVGEEATVHVPQGTHMKRLARSRCIAYTIVMYSLYYRSTVALLCPSGRTLGERLAKSQ